jgi:signal transduction histidine kinase
MTTIDRWFAGPRRLVAVFVLLLLVPAAAVVWLALTSLAQERELERRQIAERRALVADRIAAHLAQAVTATERQLVADPEAISIDAEDDAVLVTVGAHRTVARPARHLLYDPAPASLLPGVADPFREADVLEFQSRGSEAATSAYRALAQSSHPSTRAGALVRLGRTLKNAGRHDAALRAYDDLASLGDVPIEGVPAGLVARRARAMVFETLNRPDDLRAEAEALRIDLLAPRFIVDRATFSTWLQQADGWLGDRSTDERLALADAATWLWQERQERRLTVSGRHSRDRQTLLWQTRGDEIVALVAGPRWVTRYWIAPLTSHDGQETIDVALVWPDDAPGAEDPPTVTIERRTAADAGLPWAITVTDRGPAPPNPNATRRSAQLAGLGLLLVVVVSGLVVVTRSVTRELAVARVQSDFVAAVSHEFRTPLTSLQQFTTLLADDESLPVEKRRSFYHAQARATNRLQHLVESLLDFQRMEAGARPYDFQTLPVFGFVDSIVDAFRAEAPADFTIDCRVTCGAEPIRVDREALGRAIWNLLDNAVKYSGESRRVSVDVSRHGGEVAIAVRDDGLGVPWAEQRAIFTKFFRGAIGRTRGIHGTGLGLAMVRHIAAAHRGRVTVTSEEGRGSTFTICLPIADMDAAPVTGLPAGDVRRT